MKAKLFFVLCALGVVLSASTSYAQICKEMYAGDGWSGFDPNTAYCKAYGFLEPGSRLYKGEYVCSGPIRFGLDLNGDLSMWKRQSDGNFRKIWGAETSGDVHVNFQATGNLVVYSESDHSVQWASNTGGNYGTQLIVRSDGSPAVIETYYGRTLWSSYERNTTECPSRLYLRAVPVPGSPIFIDWTSGTTMVWINEEFQGIGCQNCVYSQDLTYNISADQRFECPAEIYIEAYTHEGNVYHDWERNPSAPLQLHRVNNHSGTQYCSYKLPNGMFSYELRHCENFS